MEKKEVTILNQALHYIEIGEGTPLVILHGWGSSAQVMTPLAQVLSVHHRCYVLDLPGFGNSPAPHSAWAVSDYADFVAQFIEQVVGKKSDLLVHSFGGRITLKLLERTWSKTWIGKVLITGGAGMKPRRTWRFYYRKYLGKTLKAPFLILPKSLQEKGLNQLRKTDLWKSLGSSDYQQLQGVLREVFVKTVSEFLESCLPKIEHEVFLLWGKTDDSTPWYQAERMHKGIKNSALVGIDNAGHYAFLDQSASFYAIANAYLNPPKSN